LTASELLVLIGRAWSRLLLYPGGLAAFGLAWLITIAERHLERRPCITAKKGAFTLLQSSLRSLRSLRLEYLASALGDTRAWGQTPGSRIMDGPASARFWLEISAVVFPWLGLALLPLPLAVTLSRQTDVVVAMALLEWPLLLAVAQAIWADSEADQRIGLFQAAAALNSYPALILATLTLARGAGAATWRTCTCRRRRAALDRHDRMDAGAATGAWSWAVRRWRGRAARES
jgi:hypothetical protein